MRNVQHNDNGRFSQERLVNKGLSDIGMGSTTWGFRFNAPGKLNRNARSSYPIR
jgi:hypothetical protein